MYHICTPAGLIRVKRHDELRQKKIAKIGQRLAEIWPREMSEPGGGRRPWRGGRGSDVTLRSIKSFRGPATGKKALKKSKTLDLGS